METLKQLEALVATKIALINSIWSIIRLETLLAGLSVLPLVFTLCLLIVVLITVWLSAMFLLGYCFLLAFDQMLLAIGLVLLLNIGFLLGLVQYLSFNLKNMSFQKTRNYFSQHKSSEHEKLEKANNETNCNDGKNNSMSGKRGNEA